MSVEHPAVRLLHWMRRAEVAISVTAFAILIGVIFADVLARRITGSGLIWAREVGVFANIVLSLIGIGLASAGGTHLRPRFTDRWVPTSWNAGMMRIQDLLTAIAFAILAGIAVLVLRETIELDQPSNVLRIAVWPIQICLPLAFAIGAIRHAIFAALPVLRPAERSEVDVAEGAPNSLATNSSKVLS